MHGKCLLLTGIRPGGRISQENMIAQVPRFARVIGKRVKIPYGTAAVCIEVCSGKREQPTGREGHERPSEMSVRKPA